MKKLNKIPALLAALFISASAFAITPNYEVWDYDSNPLDEVLDMEEIPEIITAKPLVMSPLKIEAQATKDNFLTLSLPYADTDVIGVVVYDKKGHIIFNEKDEYRMLKTVLIADSGDNEYVIKAYRQNAIHQAKLKVAHE